MTTALILALIALLLIAKRAMPKDFHVERSIVINKPVDGVFAYIRQLRNNQHWNAWSLKDPKAEKAYKGIDGNPGFIATWKSPHKDVGTGEQEIMEIIDNQKLACQIRLTSPFKATFPSVLLTEPQGEGQTRVTMVMKDKMIFPLGLLCMLMRRHEVIAREFDASLRNLKTILE